MHAKCTYILFYISFIIALLDLIFFILFLISIVHHVKLNQTTQYSTISNEWPVHIKKMIALEFFMFFLGIGQFIFYFSAFKSKNNEIFILLIIISISCFIGCWIASTVLFFSSPEFNFIKSLDSSNVNVLIYSLESFNEQIGKWSRQAPLLYFQAIGSTDSKICSGFINITTQNKQYSYDSITADMRDIVGDSLIMIDLQIDIKWNLDNEKSINDIYDEIKKCTINTLEANVTKYASLQNVPDAIFMTKNGKIPKKLSKKWAITRGFFGLGVDVMTDLTSIPVYKRAITVSDPHFNYSFDCSKLDYKCHNVPSDVEINDEIKQLKNDQKIDPKSSKYSIFQKAIKKVINNLFFHEITIEQKRLSRSFYLSQCAYSGKFEYYKEDEMYSPMYFKQKLIRMLKSDSNCAVFKPAWYVGTYGNELYVVIRGSHSPFDWCTNSQVQTIVATKYSYHRGFYLAAKYVWGEILETVIDYKNKGYTIIFTGHSLGGSVAQILHHLFSQSYNSGIYSYVFGAAASMGKTPAEDIKENCFSVVNINDIVPRLMHYVTYLKEKGVWPNYIIRTQFSESVEFNLKDSLYWCSTAFEDIDYPVGTIYHLPYRDEPSFLWPSISTTKITVTDDFFNYDLQSIQTCIEHHKTFGYYLNLQYYDGLIEPSKLE